MLTTHIKTIIVDDEQPSRIALSTYITEFCNDIEIVAECNSVETAWEAILKHHPHLVFLDIEMPNGNGFDLLSRFKTIPFKVIFVTAYSDYAIRAFRYAAADYLLKPVKVDELAEAVERVRIDLHKDDKNENLEVLLESLSTKNGILKQMVIRDSKGFTVIKVDDLIMCEADAYCTIMHLSGDRKITSTKSLGYYEELFEKGPMLKVHRSFLINPDKVTGYTRQGEIHLEENLTCPLGNNYKPEFLERFEG